MPLSRCATLAATLALAATPSLTRAQVAALPKSIHPTVRAIVSQVSEDRIAQTMKKLEAFGARNTVGNATSDPTQGIEAARQWIANELKSYSPKLNVRFDSYRVKKTGRLIRDTDVVNVIAELPGEVSPDVHVMIGGHYDSMSFVRLPGVAMDEAARLDPAAIAQAAEATAKETRAPGVSDDASGVAAVMELARVMSAHKFDKTLVFIAFAGEEQGLLGSSLLAARMKREGKQVEALLNNDIIGNDVAGNGFTASHAVRVFSGDPPDSPSRALARYIKDAAERYVPAMNVNLIYRQDRFGRGGDHTPFHMNGFAAVRFTTPAENLGNQHTPNDTFANASAPYTTRVAKVNAAALASLALAPRPPEVTRVPTTQQRDSAGSANPVADLGRGPARYDAVLRWKHRGETAEADLAGYAVMIRSTLAPFWEREIFTGNVNEYIIENFSIDDVILGVKAIDKSGLESMVSAYPDSVRRFREPELVKPAEAPSSGAAPN